MSCTMPRAHSPSPQTPPARTDCSAVPWTPPPQSGRGSGQDIDSDQIPRTPYPSRGTRRVSQSRVAPGSSEALSVRRGPPPGHRRPWTPIPAGRVVRPSPRRHSVEPDSRASTPSPTGVDTVWFRSAERQSPLLKSLLEDSQRLLPYPWSALRSETGTPSSWSNPAQPAPSSALVAGAPMPFGRSAG